MHENTEITLFGIGLVTLNTDELAESQPISVESSDKLWYKNACQGDIFCLRGVIFFPTVSNEKLGHNIKISRFWGILSNWQFGQVKVSNVFTSHWVKLSSERVDLTNGAFDTP